MTYQRYGALVGIALSAAFLAACANSEPVDVDSISRNRPPSTGSGGSIDPSGLAGSGGPGIAGSSAGGTDPTGIGGSSGGSKASTGTAGTGDHITTTGSAGTTGTDDGGVSGQAGSAGGSFGGSAGGSSGGSVGGSAGGRGGNTGFGGRGGGGGSAGATGSAGRGGAGGRGGGAGSGSPDGGTADGGTAATFTDIYTNILVPHCSGSQCHNPGSQKGISFASQSTGYTAVKNRVTPGNGAGSSFYSTVNSGSMPPGGPKLSSADLAKIKAWIDAGALNN
jgi:hypothetical protein